MIKKILLIWIGIFSILYLVSATNVNDTMHVSLRITNPSGTVLALQTFNFTFNISTTPDCASIVYTDFTSITTDANGIISYYLENVNGTQFNSTHYLCSYRDGVVIINDTLAKVPYSFWADRAENVSWQGVIGRPTNLSEFTIDLNDTYVPYSGATADVDLNSKRLTAVGALIMQGLLTSQDVIPTTHNLYSLGNSTHWYSDLFVTRIQASNISADYVNATNIDSAEVNISDNLTIAGYKVTDEEGDLTLTLT